MGVSLGRICSILNLTFWTLTYKKEVRWLVISWQFKNNELLSFKSRMLDLLLPQRISLNKICFDTADVEIWKVEWDKLGMNGYYYLHSNYPSSWYHSLKQIVGFLVSILEPTSSWHRFIILIQSEFSLELSQCG